MKQLILLGGKENRMGKFLNSGQTCVAPDYIFVHKSVKDKLAEADDQTDPRCLGADPCRNEEYPKMINEKHYERVLGLTKDAHVVCGGGSRKETLQIEPTILDQVSWDHPVMQEEIFGPIMPILVYDNLDDVIRKINDMPHPWRFTSSLLIR